MGRITWDSDVQFLKGVGPVRSRALMRLGIVSVGDLLRHYPRRWLDRSTVTPIASVVPGAEVTIAGEILTAGGRPTRRGRSLQTVSVGDQSGVLFCVWFGQSYVTRQFRSGMRVLISGTVQLHQGRKQIVHPDFEIQDREGPGLHTGRLVPIYPLTSGIGQHWLRQRIHDALMLLKDDLVDPLPEAQQREHGFCDFRNALYGMHFPDSIDHKNEACRRLIHDEIFFLQLVMAMRRRFRGDAAGIRLSAPGALTTRVVDALPFELTGAQRRVLTEILRDLRSGRLMHRLVQGDVGSGKTLVALIAALFVIEQGWQSMIMAPTEVLARQHGDTIARLCARLDVSVETLTGSTPAAERRRILAGAAAGEIDIIVGTHALLEDEVHLPRPGLIVVDEQHRFGVHQRGQAGQSDTNCPPHMLVMSATPIPRSLALTLCGDLDLSVIDEMPLGRRPIATRLLVGKQATEAWFQAAREMTAGRRVFIIYPVIEETEGQDLKAAEAEYDRLRQGALSEFRLGLLHGRQKARDKQRTMAAFAAGEIQALVATTVVEVGVDVPEATVMIINHPDRFGLAQLHQLRGRVGRGDQPASCFLLTDRWLPPETQQRLEILCRTGDGFKLAEEDLRLRGPGDLLGVRQHGAPSFRLANPLRDAHLVEDCRREVEALLATDPELSLPKHRSLSETLHRDLGRLLVQAVG